ncbi:hypothetical protein C8J56DRAFT_1111363 [Mycena floridula]|nr:hypothetical protein C8J56DRAFT_1111363 [Mycena floridula]
MAMILIAFLCGICFGRLVSGTELTVLVKVLVATGWLTFTILFAVRGKCIATFIISTSLLLVAKIVERLPEWFVALQKHLPEEWRVFIETNVNRYPVINETLVWTRERLPTFANDLKEFAKTLDAESIVTYSRRGLKVLSDSAVKLALAYLALLAAFSGQVLALLAEEAVALSKTLSAPPPSASEDQEESESLLFPKSDEGTDEEDYASAATAEGISTGVEVDL